MQAAFSNFQVMGLLNAIIPATLAIAMWEYKQTRKTYPGFEKWALAFMSLGMGFLLIDLRGLIHDLFSVVIGNYLLVYAILLINQGIDLFFGQINKTQKTLAYLFAAYLVAQPYFTFIEPNINTRIILTSSIIFITSIPAGLALYKQANIGHFQTSKGAAITLFIAALVNITRILYTLKSSKAISINSDPFMSWHSLIFTTILTVLSMYFFFLNSARIEYDLEIAHQKMIELANTDPLTGLYNRRHFFEHAQREFERAKNHNLSLSILIIDLDIFKQINDQYGHAIGDKVLMHASEVFKTQIRGFDLVARFGGDEFVILLKEVNEKQAQIVAEKIRFHIEENPILHNEMNIPIFLSIGLTSLSTKDEDVNALMRRADGALYKAKELGRNRVVVTIQVSTPAV